MTTIDHLNDEIRALQDKNVVWETQLTVLLLQGTEEMTTGQQQEHAAKMKSFGDRISENNQLILENKKQITADKEKEAAEKQREAAKEKQITADKEKEAAEKQREAAKEKQIAADKEKEAAEKQNEAAKEKQIAADKEKDASKERQIAADKEYRLKRVSWLPNLLASTLLALVWSALETHGVPFFISALEKYGGSYIRDRAVQFSSWAVQFKTAHPGLYLLIHLIPSFALVSNGLVEYLAKFGLGQWFGDESEETQPRHAAEMKVNVDHSSLRHRIKDGGSSGAGGTG